MPAAFDTEQLIRRFDAINERLRMLEEQMVRVSGEVGVPYSPPAQEVDPEVVALARAGKQLEAIKRYRELTGADVNAARDVVMMI